MPAIEIATVGLVDLWRYAALLVGVAASWIGIPIVGGAVLATAGVLASDGQLDLWLVLVVAAAGAWTGGYVGYLIGARANDVLMAHPGRWQRQRQRALSIGERVYRRWGPFAVFLTPTLGVGRSADAAQLLPDLEWPRRDRLKRRHGVRRLRHRSRGSWPALGQARPRRVDGCRSRDHRHRGNPPVSPRTVRRRMKTGPASRAWLTRAGRTRATH